MSLPDTRLFAEFPPVSTAEWMEVVTKDLKGADFEKRLVSSTLDGIKLKPFYRAEDLPDPLDSALHSRRTDGNHWILREEVREDDVTAANRHALNSLNRGAEELAFYTYPIGAQVHSAADFQRLLNGIWIEAVPIHWISGPLTPQLLALLVQEAQRRGLALDTLRGTVDLDPILDRCAGWTSAPLTDWQADLLQTTDFLLRNLPGYGLVTVRGALVEKAGASLAQELAFTLALWVEYLTVTQEALAQGRLTVPGAQTPEEALAAIIARSELRFGVGTNYFLEAAKLRAVRVMIRHVVTAFGMPEEARPHLHAITTSSNKTLYDPHNNLLRATIESIAAIVAGVDSLTVAAYDQGYHAPDEFSEHLARNTETVLKQEAYLGRVSDPLAGSYTVESLTHSLAEAAWHLFERIEAEGGFVAAWQSGLIASELNRVRAARAKQVSTRRRTIVGTTVYPNLKECRLADVQPREPAYQVAASPSGTPTIEAYVEAFRNGKTLDGMFTAQRVPSTALDPFRPSWPYEHLRLRVERHVATGGRKPLVFLALLGDLTMRRARAGFCQGLFGVGGYAVQEQTLSCAAQALRSAREVGADALVLCSSDPEYVGIVKELETEVAADTGPKLPLIVAGYPQDAVAELQAHGVTDFIHIRQDLLETLTRYHDLFGVPQIPLDGPLNPMQNPQPGGNQP